MTTRAYLVAVLACLGACSETHDNIHVEVQAKDCVACHMADYMDTNVVDHMAFGFPQTCSDCHMAPPKQPTWKVVETDLTGTCVFPCRRHTEDKFSITRPPHKVPDIVLACVACHSFGSQPPLTLPSGAMAENVNCENCHDRTMGTPPVGVIDQTHVGPGSNCIAPGCPVSGYAWSSTQTNFCLTCHPAGTI